MPCGHINTPELAATRCFVPQPFSLPIFQPAVATAKREVVRYRSTQHKLGVRQGLVVEQPMVQNKMHGWLFWLKMIVT